MVKLAVSAAAVFATTAGAAWAQQVVVTYSGPSTLRAASERAWQELQTTCPRIRAAQADIVQVVIQAREANAIEDREFAARTNHWRSIINVSVRLAERVRTIPITRDVNPHGETAHFSLGGAPNPGISMNKRISRWFCGMDTGSSDTVLRRAPNFTFIAPSVD